MKFFIGRAAVKAIHSAIEALFVRAKQRLLARRGPKQIRVSVSSKPVGIRVDLSIPGLYHSSSEEEGFQGSNHIENSLSRVVEGYMDAHQELAKVQMVNAVQNWLHEAETKKIKTDLNTVLGGELHELMGKVTSNVTRIVGTEATRARNTGSVDAISRISASASESDPNVFFVIVRDEHVCEECLEMHQLDGTLSGPPKVYKLSEIGHGYHKRGQTEPKVGGLHPHCRCTLCRLGSGYGFDGGGMVKFIDVGHDEYKKQRGEGDEGDEG